jgi:uncharacterized membrane protein
MQNDLRTHNYVPELLPRRGEYIAWALAGVALAAWIILTLGGYPVFWALPIVTILLILIALGISLGNWMDRHTWIRIDADGIEYKNGIRHAKIPWGEIRQVQVYKHQWGDKIQVIGMQSHFAFRTLGELEVGGEVKGVMGFADGEQILSKILREADLKEVEHDGSSYYYARE